jgi:hypothetical protein
MNLSPSLGAGGVSRLTVLLEDGERVLCRGWRDDGDGDETAVLAVLSASEHPAPAFVDQLAHEYGLKDELDDRSAARPLALVREHGRTMLLLKDPGGGPLARLLGHPMEMGTFFCASRQVYRLHCATYTNMASSIRTSSRPMCSLISRPVKSG